MTPDTEADYDRHPWNDRSRPQNDLEFPYIAAYSIKHTYNISAMNVSGFPPTFPGKIPFKEDYSHHLPKYNHLKKIDGSLGQYEFIKYPQVFASDAPFPPHRAFIPYKLLPPKLDPYRDVYHDKTSFSHSVRIYDVRRSLLSETMLQLQSVYQGYQHAFHLLHYEPNSELNLPATFGLGWQDLIRSYCQWQPLERLVDTDAEIIRRIGDTRGWIEMHSRSFVWNICYRMGYELPRFDPDPRLVGMICLEDLDVVSHGLFARSLAKDLGMPLWMIDEVGHERKVDTVPAGKAAKSPLWLKAIRRAVDALWRVAPNVDPTTLVEWEATVETAHHDLVVFEMQVIGQSKNVVEDWFPAEPNKDLRAVWTHPQRDHNVILRRGRRFSHFPYEVLRRAQGVAVVHLEARAEPKTGPINVAEATRDIAFSLKDVLEYEISPGTEREELKIEFPVWNASNVRLQVYLGLEHKQEWTDFKVPTKMKIVTRTIRERLLIDAAPVNAEGYKGPPIGTSPELWLVGLARANQGLLKKEEALKPRYPAVPQPIPSEIGLLDWADVKKRDRSPPPQPAKRARVLPPSSDDTELRYDDAVTPTFQSAPLPFVPLSSAPSGDPLAPSPSYNLDDLPLPLPTVLANYSLIDQDRLEEIDRTYAEPENEYIEILPVDVLHVESAPSLGSLRPPSHFVRPSSSNADQAENYDDTLLPKTRRTLAIGPEMEWCLSSSKLFLVVGPAPASSLMGQFLQRSPLQLEEALFEMMGPDVHEYRVVGAGTSESGERLYSLHLSKKKAREVRVKYVAMAQAFVLAPQWSAPVTLVTESLKTYLWTAEVSRRLKAATNRRREQRLEILAEHRHETYNIQAGWARATLGAQYEFPLKVQRAIIEQPNTRGQVVQYRKGAPYCPMTTYVFSPLELSSLIDLFRSGYGNEFEESRVDHEQECGLFYSSFYSLFKFAAPDANHQDPASRVSVPLPHKGALRALFDYCCDGRDGMSPLSDKTLPIDGVPRAVDKMGLFRLETFSWHEGSQTFRITRADLRIRTGFYSREYSFAPRYSF